MNSIYVLLVVVAYGASPPRPASFSHEFSSKETCELAKKEVMTQATNPSHKRTGGEVFIATCTPK